MQCKNSIALSCCRSYLACGRLPDCDQLMSVGSDVDYMPMTSVSSFTLNEK